MHAVKRFTFNLGFILARSDRSAVRMALYIGSLMWAIWGAVVVIAAPATIHGYIIMIKAMPLWGWALLFFIHGSVGILTLLLEQTNRALIILGSMFGAALWMISLNLVLLSHIADGILPMGGAHWMAVIIAWWIFIRDCYGR